MAKGNARKGMTMIGPTPGHRVKQLEVRTRKANGRNRSRLVEVAIKEPVVTTTGHSKLFPSSSPSKTLANTPKEGRLLLDGQTYSFILEVQTQNDYIREWLPQKEDFLHILLELEAPPVPRICKICRKDGVYRCPDCMHQPLLCTNCCRTRHEAHPFHRIQQWTGDFFEDCALHMTGLQLHLGHGGAPCPSASSNEPPPFSEKSRHATAGKGGDQAKGDTQDTRAVDDGEWEDVDNIPLHLRPPVGAKYLTIIDVTGVHFVLVRACQCPNAASYHMQLFRAKLCPSTFEKPSTTFTFSVLDDFLRDNVECGTSGMNYYSKLRRVTSNVFPHLVVDRYQELLRVARQWRLLKLLKWNGFQDNKNCSKDGDLALFCAACPQPGINYTRTVVMDGNFKAEHMHERQPDDQVWLMDGRGFMVTNPPYRAYLKATPHITEKSPCNNHKAISQASASRGKLNSTGVGATACARHGCFYPHSVVDFQKGERQLNMDYSLAHALSYNMTGINNVLCFYDINCAYMKNLQRRVDSSDFLHIQPALKITAGIGMWHVHGHKKECYARYSPLFIKGSGWVDGEIIETLWSTLNVVSASTRGMTSPHRQELLDFQMNDSNFMKMIRMADSLSRKLKTARASVVLAREAFDRFNKAITPIQRTNWRKQEESALLRCIHDPSVMDVFEIQLKKGIASSKAPTVHAVELQLLEKSTQQGIHHGAASWIRRGLAVEEAAIILNINRKDGRHNQSELTRLAIARCADKLVAERSRFIAEGRIYLRIDDEMERSDESDGRTDHMAGKDTLDDEEILSNDGDQNSAADEECGREPFDDPTSSCLTLPSMFGIDHCKANKFHRLAQMELELRIGQANDALHGLRLALADKAVIFRGAVRPATNYSMRTRAWQMIHSIDSSIKQCATIYRRCRVAIFALGAGSDILERYQELEKSHLSATAAAFTQGAHEHRSSQLPWFWTIDIPKDTNSKSWLSEFYRIHWLRAKAAQDRWEEEEELVTSEFQWVTNYFQYRARRWNETYMDNKSAGNHGAACYAARQKAVYDRLAEQGELIWQEMNPNDIAFHHDLVASLVAITLSTHIESSRAIINRSSPSYWGTVQV
ncbi:hypothetical protein BKA83DRAFT_4124303 [Pisolithus microcarpus]|nr:hypothetical protein BKA83DRAFT_4124303 [Pisolithus microcarpus]